MASTFAVTRSHLIFGFCLPLAVLLGYLLAEPYANASVSILVILFATLLVPVMMRWYHPLLILSWNLAMQPVFLPGRLQIWVVMAFAAAFFAVLNRSVDPNFRMANEPSLTRPMIVLLIVVVATALATGGVGFRVFGSKGMGGKNYLLLIGAIVGYFSLAARPIKSSRAGLAVAMFFLPGVSYAFGWLANRIGPAANFVHYLFTGDSDFSQSVLDRGFDPSLQRLTGLMPTATSIFCWMLARYGVINLLSLARPWRITALGCVVLIGSLGGFRSMLLLMTITFVVLACFERIWHSRAFLVLLIGIVVCTAALFTFSTKLPFPVQRAISFLPFEVDPLARQGAEVSTEWRVGMWKAVSVQIPEYLLLGKGYTLSSSEMALVQESTARGFVENWEASALAGDYHNGPLSVILPFGIWGVVAFGWVLWAGVAYLYRVYRDGPDEMKLINRFLLSLFVARILFFIFIFGAFYSELCVFTGILGLSVSLNTNAQIAVASKLDGPETDNGSK